jgi:uncharacterized membrane protein
VDKSQRFPAFIAYLLPIVGWLYVLLFQRKNHLAMFHVRQSIGLFLFLTLTGVAWIVVTWILTWIPFGFLFGVALFTLVIMAIVVGAVAWILGMINALRGRVALLPIFGQMASHLQI